MNKKIIKKGTHKTQSPFVQMNKVIVAYLLKNVKSGSVYERLYKDL